MESSKMHIVLRCFVEMDGMFDGSVYGCLLYRDTPFLNVRCNVPLIPLHGKLLKRFVVFKSMGTHTVGAPQHADLPLKRQLGLATYHQIFNVVGWLCQRGSTGSEASYGGCELQGFLTHFCFLLCTLLHIVGIVSGDGGWFKIWTCYSRN